MAGAGEQCFRESVKNQLLRDLRGREESTTVRSYCQEAYIKC